MHTAQECVICGAVARNRNFGVLSCESCKAFARRNAHRHEAMQCLFDDRCTITQNITHKCPGCRIRRCLEAGMKFDSLRQQTPPCEQRRQRRLAAKEQRVYKCRRQRRQLMTSANLDSEMESVLPTQTIPTTDHSDMPSYSSAILPAHRYLESSNITVRNHEFNNTHFNQTLCVPPMYELLQSIAMKRHRSPGRLFDSGQQTKISTLPTYIQASENKHAKIGVEFALASTLSAVNTHLLQNVIALNSKKSSTLA